ncbi:substrate-binding domain-containing protein [Vibrio sp. JC009]|uniref:substrate-binding domain-containing protein n=1 Tax=Vibrio sp. JC009 TaxID=2912314 RepID=UPI0023B15727|nr:substrate-binding domain-containing protein [Vibrio sp. JC009]WED24618.1 substrate-binding domain-containing protein [Vibrio sp. JC009]
MTPKVALVMKALSNPFFAKMEKGAKDYASNKDIQLEVFGVERETDVQKQITIVKRLIQQKYPAIVIAPADSKRLIPVLKEALEQNIVVINIDNALDKQGLREAGIRIPFVGSDNFKGSAMVGEYVRNKLPDGGNVLYIEGIRGNENADLRKSGFLSGLEGGAFTTVGSISANWHADEAMTLVAEFISEGSGTVDVIACANDMMALGALQAINALFDGENRPLITGYDNIPEVHSELFSGEIKATIEQNPDLMGAYGLKLAIQGLQGMELPGYEPTPLNLISHDTFGKKVLFSISNQANPFFSTLADGARKTAELHGLLVEFTDAQNDNARQLEQILNSLESDIELAIINPTDSVTIGPGIELINSENIPVVTVDRQSIDGTIITHIASDNSQGGRMAAEYISEKLPGGGRILEIQGILGTSAAHERGKGFNDFFKNRKNIVIERVTADFDAEKSQKIVTEMLESGHHFDAVFAHNDEMIFGAMKALQSFYGTERSSNKMSFEAPVLVGFDAISKVVDAVQRGDISATIAQKPDLMGSMAISISADIIRSMTVEQEIKVDLQLVKQGTQQY